MIAIVRRPGRVPELQCRLHERPGPTINISIIIISIVVVVVVVWILLLVLLLLYVVYLISQNLSLPNTIEHHWNMQSDSFVFDVLSQRRLRERPGPQDSSKGVQWKQGVVICMMLCISLSYNTTPIHCTPLPLHPPVMNTQDRGDRMCGFDDPGLT